MRSLVIAMTCASLLLPAIAQKKGAQRKFAKYETPMAVRTIDWLLLQVNVRLMRDIEAARDLDKAETPFLYYDDRSGKIHASVRVSEDTAKGSLDVLRMLLTRRLATALAEVKQGIPELRDEDVEIVFWHVDLHDVRDVRRIEFAVFRNGNLTFR